MKNYVLIVAGLDSAGGAGITADTITCHDLHGHSIPICTALTAQSLKRVTKVDSASVAYITECLNLALNETADGKIAAVKIGFVSDDKVLETVFNFIKANLQDAYVVWDPVLKATAGDLGSANIKSTLSKYLPYCTVITPNLEEASELSEIDSGDESFAKLREISNFFLDMGVKYVYLKGGHSKVNNEFVNDFIASRESEFVLRQKKINKDGAHGGGCALSTALATLLIDNDIQDAAVLANTYVHQGILISDNEEYPRLSLEHKGYPCNLSLMPEVIEKNFPHQNYDFIKEDHQMGLYVVLDDIDLLEKLARAGVNTLQLRIKDVNLSDPKESAILDEKIKRAVAVGRECNVKVYIDDYVEKACQFGAYGVHLGMEDLETANLSLIKEANIHLGVSTHNVYEMLKALYLSPSYIALGHVFDTTTKKMKSRAQGVSKLSYEVALLNKSIANCAIGGINLTNIHDVLASKVDSIALVSAVTKASDPILAAKNIMQIIKDHKCKDI